ncbi:dnaJ homolog subfamily C member 25 homolog [Dreissena polymorpha]|uniref:dnaJ homolog subfamily C member 25 homolog n=1 Tax=Dreissena polymorpha TaxID=45954 RepID=UPI0022654659|nr:dnaJ homolog subfamily C member 25 homolog [Dreissena polymorpha]
MNSCWSIFVFCLFLAPTSGYVDNLYCGEKNCYEILDVSRESTKAKITKAYRKLAKVWHPDMHKTDEKKDEASKKFQEIANAYEILTGEDSRNDYDYMLDHPDEFYYNYYRYYKTHTAPKVDVRVVIVITITVISIVQYYGAWANYQSAISYLCKDQKYRIQATNIAKERGLFPVANKRDARKSKEEVKEKEEAILKEIIEENLDIRGGYSKPTYRDILWVQLVFFPYQLVMYIKWFLRWVWKFSIMKQEYGREEKLHLIRKNLKLNTSQFDAIEEQEKEDYLSKELWKKTEFEKWKQAQEEELLSKRAESGRYKMIRRYMKKGGPGQMTFGPE